MTSELRATSLSTCEQADSTSYQELLNEQHRDALALIVRYAASVSTAEQVELHHLDPLGLLLRVSERFERPRIIEVPFDRPARSLREMQNEVVKLVFSARLVAGVGVPITRLESQHARSNVLRVHRGTVLSRRVLSPRIFCLTLRTDLQGFTTPGYDAFVFLCAPTTLGGKALFDRDFSMPEYRALPEHERPTGAHMTVRAVRDGEIDIWCVHHNAPADVSSSVVAWAWQARQGDPVAFWGPRTAFEPPPGTRSYLLIADEAALPATLGVIETLSSTVPITLLVECASAEEQLPVPLRPNLKVQWCYRQEAPAGSSGALEKACAALQLKRDGLYVFGGGEADEMMRLSRLLQLKHRLASRQIQLSGFWRNDQRNGVSVRLFRRQ